MAILSSGKLSLVDVNGRPIRAAMTDTAHFAASQTAREMATFNPPLYSADGALAGEIETMAARAYDLERNHGVASGAIQTVIDNVVGTGLRLSAKPDWRSLGWTKERADEWGRAVEAKWRTFASKPTFDAARHHTFGGMTVMQLRTAFLSGEALALALWRPDRPGAKWATNFQAIDPARLYDTVAGMSNNAQQGIERNEYGEPVAYWIRKTHPGELTFSSAAGDSGEFVRVPAYTRFGRQRVLHIYDKKRPGQSRGATILASVMGAFRMLDRYQRTELQTAVINSMIAAFIETPMTGEDIATIFGGNDPERAYEKYMESRTGWDVQLEGAGVIPLHPGDKLNTFNPNRPNSAYGSYVEQTLRYIGAGLNMPYELVLKDFSKTNYSSARAALMEAWRTFTAIRHWLIEQWATPVYELWLEEAVSKGEVDAPDFYENRDAYTGCKWIGPGRGWIDPLKEAQASEKRLQTTSTLEDECAEQGRDWEEVIDQRIRERIYLRDREREAGLSPEVLPGQAAPTGPEPTPPAQDDDDRPEDQEGEQ